MDIRTKSQGGEPTYNVSVGRAGKDEVMRLFRPYPQSQDGTLKAGLGGKKITFPDKYCHASEFADYIQKQFPLLQGCGGFSSFAVEALQGPNFWM
ncbi:hypothetical protein GJAV_G00114430 [Gymnothorax javanicus]|nr:hypothetical protein GJAV_G00114430 [Gymnothorax javanicus]